MPGFLVGHCALRRKVMGAERGGEVASETEVAEMRRLLAESLDAGGLGFSSSQSRTHSDGDGNPVTSRFADRAEMLAFCEEVGRHEGTTLEYITNGCLDMFSDEEIDLMVAMSATAQRPLNWNVLTVDSRSRDKVERQLEASRAASAAGGRIVALTMPTLVPMNMSFRNFCALFLIPGWGDVMGLPVPERMAALSKPEVRAQLDELAHAKEAGVFRRLSNWGELHHRGHLLEGERAIPVARRRRRRLRAGQGALRHAARPRDLRRSADGPVAQGVRRRRCQLAAASEPLGGRRRAPRGSDAGAHLDRMCGSNYPTAFLRDCLRGRKLTSVERAVQMMTDDPAKLFGIRDRGQVAEGMFADLMVFDPETVGSEPAQLVDDLPGGSPRLFAASEGVHLVLVNGAETVVDGKPTGAEPGTLLRSGRDTYTVSPAARS